MYYLDTNALAAIAEGNPKFVKFMEGDFIISDITLAEFYGIVLKEFNELTANYWYKKLSPYSKPADKLIMVKSIKFNHQNKKLSFFDCVGYVFSVENNHTFVTGDKGFEKMANVELIKK